MKNLLRSIILCCILTLTACDKFLDIVPVGSVIPSTVTEYRALLARSYKDVISLRDRELAGLRSYELMAIQGEWNNFDAFRDIENWNDDQANPNTLSFEWERYYNVIFIANEVIAAGNGMKDGTQEEKDQLVGEAYLLRAYMHFTLVNLFGQPYTLKGGPEMKAVPLKLDNDLEEVLGRSTVGQVYESIQSDINTARELMNVEKWDAAFAYRFNTVALEAFQAKVSLYKADWEACLKACELVLGKNSQLEDMKKDEAQLPNANFSVENILPLEMVVTSLLTNDTMVRKEFADKYTDGDLRLAKYFGEPDSDGNRSIAKGGTNDYLCSFRTGEIYLTAAEAAAQQNNLSKARTYLLKLMQNRYTEEAYTAKETGVDAMNQKELIAEILAERERELALEGHSWFDLRRTTRPELTKTIKGVKYVLKHDDPRYTLQIPKEALDVNPGLRN